MINFEMKPENKPSIDNANVNHGRIGKLNYQPLFGNGTRASSFPGASGRNVDEKAAEIEPNE